MKACLILLFAVVFVAIASGEKRLIIDGEALNALILKLKAALTSSTPIMQVCKDTCHAIAGQYIFLCDAACEVTVVG